MHSNFYVQVKLTKTLEDNFSLLLLAKHAWALAPAHAASLGLSGSLKVEASRCPLHKGPCALPLSPQSMPALPPPPPPLWDEK